ncbi:MAG TPA: cobalamin-binding protein [Nitrosomonas sp.]|nr:cobalamin-binding protein [Nitrosomonas sp.]HMW19566.1 cobalamin-binding protein [Nitrosomonas sp.]HMW68067.1 cobalamin-binding protein [Nitrosomonas sp.]HMY62374.1 cobalamin-binding protein [Nitrosomonas sp.]HNA70371.1 cobalamin-binding protein [Nitrosomonas sp.]
MGLVVADTQGNRSDSLNLANRSNNIDFNAKRIISLSPAITELVFSAGAGGKLVGVSRFSNFPSEAQLIPEIGDAYNLDLEKIIEISPELIIAWKQASIHKDLDRLNNLGFQILEIEIKSLDDIPNLIRLIGKLAETAERAALAASQYEKTLLQMKQNYDNRTLISVLQLIWLQPLITFGKDHLINEILGVCGGENVANFYPGSTFALATENIVAANPEVIFDSTATMPEVRDLFKKLSSISAVKNDYIYFIPPDLIFRETVRALDAIQIACDYFDEVREKMYQ